MVDPLTSRFWQAAIQSRLIDATELTACWEALPPPRSKWPINSTAACARQAVHAGLLHTLAGRSSCSPGGRPGSRSTATSCST